MQDLIKALQILLKYNPNNPFPTHCEHDILYVCGVDPSEVSQVDIDILDNLGFFIDEENDCFASYRYGSC